MKTQDDEPKVDRAKVNWCQRTGKSWIVLPKAHHLRRGTKQPKGPVNWSSKNLKDLKDDLRTLDTPREPSALYCWIPEILHSDPKGRRALLRVLSKVGRSVCLCWAHS